MRKYLHFIWGFIGVIAGLIITIFVPSTQGKWDITSLAGLMLVILFAVLSADRLKEYGERLEKQYHDHVDELTKQNTGFSQILKNQNDILGEMTNDLREIRRDVSQFRGDK